MVSCVTMSNRLAPIYFTRRVIISSRQEFCKIVTDQKWRNIIALNRPIMLFNKIHGLNMHDNIAYYWKKRQSIMSCHFFWDVLSTAQLSFGMYYQLHSGWDFATTER